MTQGDGRPGNGFLEWLALPGTDAILRKAAVSASGMTVRGTTPPRLDSTWSGLRLPPAPASVESMQVWYVDWPHADGSTKPRPAVVMLVPGGSMAVMLRVSSLSGPFRRGGGRVELEDCRGAGLAKASAVDANAWASASVVKLPKQGRYLGTLSPRDARSVGTAFRQSLTRRLG